MKKVLIITYYWPPAGGGGVQRWVKFVKYLRDFGWEPVVYTVSNGDYPILDPELEAEVPAGITVIRQPITEPYGLYARLTGKKKGEKVDANFLSQGKQLGWKEKVAVWIRGNFFVPDARFLWIRPSVRFLSRYLADHRVDAIISTGPPHTCHLIARDIKRKFPVPWIVDYRDPWTQIDYFDDLGLTSYARRKHESLEKSCLDLCDVIVTVGRTMAEDLNAISHTRKVVITNGFDEEDRADNQTTPDSEFSIVYIGTMNDARNPEVLWQAVSQLRDEHHPLVSELAVKLVGKPEKVVSDSVRRYGLEQIVKFEGYVTHREAIRFQNASQALLLVINRTSNNKSILTGKIFEYLAAGRPVICIGPQDGDAAEIIRESGAGKMIGYEDVSLLKNHLKELYIGFKSGASGISAKGINKYSRRSLTGRLAALLDEITVKKQSHT